MNLRRTLLFLATLTGSPLLLAAEAPAAPVSVYAASSLTNVLDEIAGSYRRESGHAVSPSYAASSTLARQIEAGAKADIFLSADAEWMDYLQGRGLLDPQSRSNLLGNRLVLIAPADSAMKITIGPGFALAAALGSGRLSVADPDSVPAGKYARSALLSLGAWNEVADRLVRADNVRTALAFVDRGECPLGIVYETDALIDHRVRIVATFAADAHPPIVYPVALTRAAGNDARDFIAYLHGSTAQAAFKKYGFIPP